MSSDPALVTARISGGSGEPAHSVWSGIAEKLQTATLGEFQIIRELGRGGMAAVFLAHDIHLDRKVAIKVMSPMLGSDVSMVERFRREAKTGAGLKHPNIGTVHRVLEGEGLYFFVMDFVRGRPLDAILQRNGALTVEVTRALLYQIGSGLAYAHRRKIYHRDVKPANVLVGASDGTAVVTDFGIAKVAESPNQTQTGAVIGTPAYMAPEQILGREITGAVDQYALGVMAYEMLIGSPPFVGTSFVVMHAHTELKPPSIRNVRPDCPVDFDDAIARMLAKNPADRWPSLPQALAALGATAIGEDDPIREEIIRLATPDDAESARYATNTPLSPLPPTSARAASVAMVALSSPPDVIEVGDSFRLVASPRDARGEAITGLPVDWKSTNDEVFSVQADGTIVARAAGTAEVSATVGRARGAVRLAASAPAVVALRLAADPQRPVVGDRVRVTATAVDTRGRPLRDRPIAWSLSNLELVRIISDGVFDATAAGSLYVTAACDGMQATIDVVIEPARVASIRVSTPPSKIVAGSTFRLAAATLDARGNSLTGHTIEWMTSDAKVASVSGDGIVTTLGPGNVKVIASCEGKTVSVAITIRGSRNSEPSAPKVVVVPAPANPMEYSATGILSPNSAPIATPGQRSPTPVLSPAASAVHAEPVGLKNKKVWLFAGTGAVLAAMAVIAVLTRPQASPRDDPRAVAPAATPAPVAPQAAKPTPVVTLPDTTARSARPSGSNAPTVEKKAAQRTDQASRGAATGKTTAIGATSPPVQRRDPDIFQLTIQSAPPPLHIGDRVTLRANVERTSGRAPMPRIVWESSRPDVVGIDAGTGAATAMAEGQAVIRASGGDTRAEVTVTVLAAAPIAAPPPPTRPVVPPETQTRPSGLSADELRTKAADVLRESAGAMIAAVRAKDVATVTRLFADGRNKDAQDLLNRLPDLFKPVVTPQIAQSQISDRAGSLDYQMKLDWESAAGPPRERIYSMRVEVERTGDAWTVARHRVLSVQVVR